MHLLLLFITSIPEVKMKAAMDGYSGGTKKQCLKKEWMLYSYRLWKQMVKEQDLAGLAQKASDEYDAMVAAEVATSSRTRKTQEARLCGIVCRTVVKNKAWHTYIDL